MKKHSLKTTKTQFILDFFSFINKSKFYIRRKVKNTFENNAFIKIPEIFSLIENPTEVIQLYQTIFNISKKKYKGIFFDHSECKVIDIAASTVMDIFIMNLDDYYKKRDISLNYYGRLPQDTKNKIILFASGIVKHLEATDKNIEREIGKLTESGQIKLLELINGGQSSKTLRVKKTNVSGFAADQLSNYFRECLETQGWSITPEGVDYICQLVGETINNSELHSGEFCQWFTLGHYSQDKDTDHGECQIVLFNFGQTIYEGLKKSMLSEELRRSLQYLSDMHTQKGFFNVKIWDEETLWTLYSLQDGVSRFTSDDEPDRGTGTVKLIDAFQKIGGTSYGKSPQMSIISGHACIYFDGKYILQNVQVGKEFRQRIAFNEQNDLELPPDPNYVKRLDYYFPGTVISMKFYLDSKFISQIRGE